MVKRTATLILAVLLLPYLPSYDLVEEHTEFDNLESLSERIEISPNPNSILDWGEPATTEGIEEIRDETAESTIGMFTHSGLIGNSRIGKCRNSLDNPSIRISCARDFRPTKITG